MTAHRFLAFAVLFLLASTQVSAEGICLLPGCSECTFDHSNTDIVINTNKTIVQGSITCKVELVSPLLHWANLQPVPTLRKESIVYVKDETNPWQTSMNVLSFNAATTIPLELPTSASTDGMSGFTFDVLLKVDENSSPARQTVATVLALGAMGVEGTIRLYVKKTGPQTVVAGFSIMKATKDTKNSLGIETKNTFIAGQWTRLVFKYASASDYSIMLHDVDSGPTVASTISWATGFVFSKILLGSDSACLDKEASLLEQCAQTISATDMPPSYSNGGGWVRQTTNLSATGGLAGQVAAFYVTSTNASADEKETEQEKKSRNMLTAVLAVSSVIGVVIAIFCVVRCVNKRYKQEEEGGLDQDLIPMSSSAYTHM